MQRVLVPFVGAALFAGLATLLIWDRPRSPAEERRRRRDNDRHRISAKQRIGDTRWSAWSFGLMFAGAAIWSLGLGVWALLR